MLTQCADIPESQVSLAANPSGLSYASLYDDHHYINYPVRYDSHSQFQPIRSSVICGGPTQSAPDLIWTDPSIHRSYDKKNSICFFRSAVSEVKVWQHLEYLFLYYHVANIR